MSDKYLSESSSRPTHSTDFSRMRVSEEWTMATAFSVVEDGGACVELLAEDLAAEQKHVRLSYNQLVVNKMHSRHRLQTDCTSEL